jgi:hypothetical protein
MKSLVPKRSFIHLFVRSFTRPSEAVKMPKDQFNNDGVGELKVPGHGLPIEFLVAEATASGGPGSYFPNGINDFRPERYTAKELYILQFMDTVTDKPLQYP